MSALQSIDAAINTARILHAAEKHGTEKEISLLGLYHRLLEVRNSIMLQLHKEAAQ